MMARGFSMNVLKDVSHLIAVSSSHTRASLDSVNVATCRIDMSGANLTGSVFDGADLSYAQLADCTIAGARFAGAKMDSARLPEGLSNNGEAAE